MNRQDWIARCAARLQDQWPRLPRELLAEVAEQVRREVETQLDEPERAAATWLHQGIPDAHA